MEESCDCSGGISARALHFVFKVSNRTLTAKFYRDILGMKVLRHEEFTQGCDAACNGPYDNRWSKTMVGYGPEDSHFVIELTYNYGVNSYEQGNDFKGITIVSKESVDRAKAQGWPFKEVDGLFELEAPGGYKIFLINEPQPTNKDPVHKVTLASSDIKRTTKYWQDILGLKLLSKTEKAVVLSYTESQTKLEFVDIGGEVNHAKAYGRIAFACPLAQQPAISKRIEAVKEKILTPLITLDTPGKATVRVIILADPDGHEICFVDEEGFTQLSAFDEQGNALLDKYIAKDPFENGKEK